MNVDKFVGEHIFIHEKYMKIVNRLIQFALAIGLYLGQNVLPSSNYWPLGINSGQMPWVCLGEGGGGRGSAVTLGSDWHIKVDEAVALYPL